MKQCELCNKEAVNVTGNLCETHLKEFRLERRLEEQRQRDELCLKLGINYNKLEDLEVDGLDNNDYPDYCDAYIYKGYQEGIALTDEQLDFLSDDRDLVYSLIYND